MKLLIVDDSETQLLGLKLIIADFARTNQIELEIYTADSGNAGFLTASAIRPDFLLTDFYMPDFTGAALLTQLESANLITRENSLIRSADALDIPVEDLAGFRLVGKNDIGLGRIKSEIIRIAGEATEFQEIRNR